MRRSLFLLGPPLVLSAFALSGRPQAEPRATGLKPMTPEAPLRLSDPDGQEMRLEELSVKAAVHGMLSLTELELRFRNPHPRRMEGRFTCVLPQGAAISRFAKEVNGRLMEGEVVERLRANRVYDAILHQMRDPALLEQDQGNRFSARVFPIEANATVRLVLSYSRLLPLEEGRRTFSLPLRGLPTMERFAFRALLAPLPGEAAEAPAGASAMTLPAGARRGSVTTVELEESRFTPERDIAISWRRGPNAAPVETLVSGDFALVAFRPVLPKPAAGGNGSWLFLVDTSASAAEAHGQRITALESLLAALPRNASVDIRAFDQEVVPLGRGSAADWAGRIRSALEVRRCLGGTDVAAALDAAEKLDLPAGSRVVLVSDGVATLGRTESASLLESARKLGAKVLLHALVLGNRQDADTLEALTHGRGRVVNLPFVDDLSSAAREAATQLTRPLGPEMTVDDSGASWIYPARFADVADGSELIALSRLRPGKASAARLLSGGSELFRSAGATPLPASSFGPLLSREAWRDYLAYLAERERTEASPAVREALATEQVKVSVERRILIPRTILLVLETEEDYRRFGLDRHALAEILTVGATGIERADRADVAAGAPREEPPKFEPRQRISRNGTRDEKKDLASRVEGGAEGGVEGGVVGGVLGGVPARDSRSVSENAPAETTTFPDAMPAAAPEQEAEGRSEVASRPPATAESGVAPRPVAPRPVAPPVAPALQPIAGPTAAALVPSWTRPAVPSADDVVRLTREVKANPLGRDGWNRLSEALAARKEWSLLLDLARRWQGYDPENPQVYECWGEAALALGRKLEAQRAFGSLVEVAPGKPELLQRAGLLLFRAGATSLAEAPLRQALKIRPDRANASRHLALVLWLTGRHAEAARVLEEACAREFPGWYLDVHRVLTEELGLVYRDWIARTPEKRSEIERRARERGIDLARRDALRVTLAWETDANDVDLHVVDPSGEECFFSHRQNASGLELYEDVTQGLGPEVVRTARVAPGAYSVGVNYFAAGPMGVARGILVVVRDDGRPGASPSVEILPFRLVPEGRDMKLLARIETGRGVGKR